MTNSIFSGDPVFVERKYVFGMIVLNHRKRTDFTLDGLFGCKKVSDLYIYAFGLLFRDEIN